MATAGTRAVLVHALDEATAIYGVAHGQPQLDVVEGRLLLVHDDVVGHAGRHRGDHELGHRLLHLLRRGLGRLARHGDVELSRLEGGRPRAALDDDHVAEPVEVGPVLDEVVLVLHVLDELAAAPLLDLERPRAHAAGAVVGGVHVGGIDRRVAGGEEHEERRLRPLEPEDHRVGVRRLDGLHVGIPVLARVETELGGRLGSLADHVERELDVLGREGLPVVPLDVPAEDITRCR